MENIYYTPTLDEFKTGFEYQIKVEGQWMYHKYMFENYIDDTKATLQEAIDRGFVRAKMIDKDDIQDLGFTFGASKGSNDIYFINSYILVFNPETKHFGITNPVGGLQNNGDEQPLNYIVEGFLRSKHHLQEIMEIRKIE